MPQLTSKQKKEWAELLVCKEGLSQKDAALKVGVSTVTINKWYREGNWERLKQSMLITRQEQLSRLYNQVDELTHAIKTRDEGTRFASPKEAETIAKLTAAIKSMENEASIADVAEVSKRLLDWLRPINHAKAVEMATILNDFIKHLLKK